jgi:hypothetical protein
MKKAISLLFMVLLSGYADDNKDAFYDLMIRNDFATFLEGGDSFLFDDKEKFIATTSDKILKEFKKNELKAAKKFNDKDVFIMGQVGSIRQTATGNAQIIFATNQPIFESFSATLDKSETDKAAELDDNKPIVIVCKNFRKSMMNMPMMHECVMADSYLDKLKESLNKDNDFSVLYEVAKIATDDFKDIDLKTKKGQEKLFKALKNIDKLSKEKQDKIKELKGKIKD